MILASLRQYVEKAINLVYDVTLLKIPNLFHRLGKESDIREVKAC